MSWKVVLLVLGSFALVVLALISAGFLPAETASELIRGSLGSKRAISGTLKEMTPLLIAGVGVYLALRAGLFNIGIEGQFLLGAITATFVGLHVPGALGVVLSLLAAMTVGAVWAWPAGWIKAYRGGHEVITTIMLNNVALFLTAGLVAGPLKDPASPSPTTETLSAATRIPALINAPPLQINLALILGGALLVVLALWLKRTVSGYELSAVGANSTAASVAGIDVRKTLVRAMTVSGAIGGFAGACQVLAFEGRFYNGFSPGYGFDALGVALLAGSSPWAMLGSAFLFGALAKGTTVVQLMGVPKGISGILLGLLIICFAAVRYRRTGNSV